MKNLLVLLTASLLAGMGSSVSANVTVFVAIRTDGQPGIGTIANPYDGSTEAKFDALLKSLGPNTTLNLAAGTYPTNGADGFQVKSGWTLEGAGMGQTILKLEPHFSTNVKHENISGSYISNVLISNLTCDGNNEGGHWPAHQAVGGIFMIGSNITIDHVETINCYGDCGDWYEQFSILLCGTATQIATNLTIENCLTHQYAAGANYTNGPGLAYCSDSQILNCTDDGSNHAFGVAYATHCKVTGCTTSPRSAWGFYNDTGTESDITIEGNTFSVSMIPIQFNSADPAEQVSILNNTLQTSNSGESGEGALVLSGQSGHDFTIEGNTFTYTGTNHGGFILNNQKKFTDLLVEDNSSNVGLIGGGGTTESVTDVSTLSGNKFNESMAELAQDETSSGANNPDVARAVTPSTTPATTPSTASATPAAVTKTVASPAASSATPSSKAILPKTNTIATPTSTTPVQSLQRALQMSSGPAKTLLLRNILATWVSQNPTAAATYVQSMADSPEKMSAVQFVAESWEALDPVHAATWLAGLPDSFPTRSGYPVAANRS